MFFNNLREEVVMDFWERILVVFGFAFTVVFALAVYIAMFGGGP